MSISTGVRFTATSALAVALIATPLVCGAQTAAKKPLPPARAAIAPPAKPALAAKPVLVAKPALFARPAVAPPAIAAKPAVAASPAIVAKPAVAPQSARPASLAVASPAARTAPTTSTVQPPRQVQTLAALPVLTHSAAPVAPLAAASIAVQPTSAVPATPATAATAPAMVNAVSTTTQSPSSLSSFLNSGSTSATSASPTSYGSSNLASVAGSQTGSRSANFAAGLGTFEGYGWTLTAFGCFRANTRVFCDFDLSDTQSRQVGLNIFGTVGLILDGGRIVTRHNAFFLGQDGTQFTVAATSPGSPVRYVMEYDDISPTFTAITLANGRDRISNVGVAAMDATQAPGTVPDRGSTAPAQAAATDPATGAPAAPAGALDKVSNAISNATTTKQKLGGMWQQMKQASQTH